MDFKQNAKDSERETTTEIISLGSTNRHSHESQPDNVQSPSVGQRGRISPAVPAPGMLFPLAATAAITANAAQELVELITHVDEPLIPLFLDQADYDIRVAAILYLQARIDRLISSESGAQARVSTEDVRLDVSNQDHTTVDDSLTTSEHAAQEDLAYYRSDYILPALKYNPNAPGKAVRCPSLARLEKNEDKHEMSVLETTSAVQELSADSQTVDKRPRRSSNLRQHVRTALARRIRRDAEERTRRVQQVTAESSAFTTTLPRSGRHSPSAPATSSNAGASNLKRLQ
ncbi:hypothetical protein LTR64_008320 [Lithohypha guttulata]|uniref:uncharacterized protein n=1 Tax=Lithohypha guttulata TaxID=1690604 RepID=UPI002DDFCC63|nr:hypothetical protein LTR51_008472 [Lithohypha guttulata]